jgi:hypothetical protein
MLGLKIIKNNEKPIISNNKMTYLETAGNKFMCQYLRSVDLGVLVSENNSFEIELFKYPKNVKYISLFDDNNEIKYNSNVKLLGRYRINAVIEDINTFMEQKRGNVKSTLDRNNDLKIIFSALYIPEENIYQLYNPFITGNLKYLE